MSNCQNVKMSVMRTLSCLKPFGMKIAKKIKNKIIFHKKLKY